MPPELYETVCPNCSKPFDVGEDVLEAHCPYCDALLRFETEAPAEEPGAAPPEPEPLPTPEAEEREAEAEAEQEVRRRLAEERQRAAEEERARRADAKARRAEEERAAREATRLAKEDDRRQREAEQAAAHEAAERRAQEEKEQRLLAREAERLERERRRVERAATRQARIEDRRRRKEEARAARRSPAPAPGPTLEPETPDPPVFRPEEPLGAVPPPPTPAAEPVSFAANAIAVTCPSCSCEVRVAPSDDRTTCPSCAAALVLEDAYADHEAVYAVQCPQCQQEHMVSARQDNGSCPHCDARLAYEDLREIPPSTAEAPQAPAAAILPPAAAEVAEAPAPPIPPPSPAPAAAPSPRPPGRFRSRKGAPPPRGAPEPASSLPPPGPEPPLAFTPSAGIPYTVACPSCSKDFQVPPREHEGNCPHCNAPLAFLTEREHAALLAAEARKKEFQAKLAQRKMREKEREEARLKRQEERREHRLGRAAQEPAASSPRPTRSLARLPWKKAAAAEPAAPGAPETEAAPTPPPSKGPRRAKRPPAAAVLSAEPPSASLPPPAAETPPAEAKKPWWSRLRAAREEKPEPPQAAPAATIEVEVAPVLAPVEKPRRGKKARQPPAEIIPAELAPEAAASAPTRERFAWLGRRALKEPSAPADTAPQAAAPPTVAAKARKGRRAAAAQGAVVPPPEAPPAEPPRRFPWLPKKGPKPPESEPPPATVEVASVDFGEVVVSATGEPEAAKAPTPAKPGKKRPRKAPASPPAAPAKAEEKRSLWSRFRAPPKPAAPEATVEVVPPELGPGFEWAAQQAPVGAAPRQRGRKRPPSADAEEPAAAPLRGPKKGLLSRLRRSQPDSEAAPATVEVAAIDFGGDATVSSEAPDPRAPSPLLRAAEELAASKPHVRTKRRR